jgi:hypothetical protein
MHNGRACYGKLYQNIKKPPQLERPFEALGFSFLRQPFTSNRAFVVCDAIEDRLSHIDQAAKGQKAKRYIHTGKAKPDTDKEEQQYIHEPFDKTDRQPFAYQFRRKKPRIYDDQKQGAR